MTRTTIARGAGFESPDRFLTGNPTLGTGAWSESTRRGGLTGGAPQGGEDSKYWSPDGFGKSGEKKAGPSVMSVAAAAAFAGTVVLSVLFWRDPGPSMFGGWLRLLPVVPLISSFSVLMLVLVSERVLRRGVLSLRETLAGRAWRDAVPWSDDDVLLMPDELFRSVEEQDRLQASYWAVMEDVGELVCRFSSEGTVLFANPAYCRMMGLDPRKLNGATFPHHGVCRPSLIGPWTLEREIITPSGSRRSVFWIVRCLGARVGAVLEYQAVGRDVTVQHAWSANLVLAQQATSAAERENGALADAVLREMRIPLAEISRFTDQLDDAMVDSEQRDRLSRIRVNLANLERLTESLGGSDGAGESCRFTAGRMVPLRAAVQEMVDAFEAHATLAKVRLGVSFAPEISEGLQVAQSALRAVMLLLLRNALSATDHGSVSVAVALSGDHVKIRVRDSGGKRTQTVLSDMMALFSEASDAAAREREGEVMRLSLAKRVCQQAGGSLSAELECGNWAVFEAVLPVGASGTDG